MQKNQGIAQNNMTVTNHIDSNAEVRMTMPETKCDANNQDDLPSNKETKILQSNNDTKKEEENPFLNNQQTTASISDGLKSENFRSNETKKDKDHYSDDLETTNHSAPPDGGLRAWMIMVASFTINGILFSVINSYSIISLELVETMKQRGESEPVARASLVGSLTIGFTFLLSPVAGMLTDKIGIQMTTFLGGALAFGGMLLASVFPDRVEILCLTYGGMYGLGASLAYTPSLVILGHYFKRRLGLVNGIVTAGSSVFTTIMPFIMEALLGQFGLVGTLRSLAILTSFVMMCAILFKPIPVNEKPVGMTTYGRSKWSEFLQQLKTIVNTTIWKKKRYVVWASAIPFALFGYFVPYALMGEFVKTAFNDKTKAKIPVMCIGISSGIGRLVFGYIADLPRVNRILLQQISFVCMGALTMMLPLAPPYFGSLLAITLLMGLFDGCFISLLGPVAFDICGRKGASQAIGCLLGLCSVPLSAGPPIASLIYSHTGTLTIPFILAGIPQIIGALAMCLVHWIKDKESEDPDKLADEPCLNGLDLIGRHRWEGRSYRQLAQATALFNASLPNFERVYYFDPYSYEQHSDCHYLVYSESVPLLFTRKKTKKKTPLLTNYCKM